MRDTQRERQRHRPREKQAPCRGPDVGFDPWSPGSHPGPKAGAQPLRHPGIPNPTILLKKIIITKDSQGLLSLLQNDLYQQPTLDGGLAGSSSGQKMPLWSWLSVSQGGHLKTGTNFGRR